METLWHAAWPSFGFAGPAYMVVQDQAAWQALWARTGPNGPTPPRVDFNTQTVLVAAYGNAPSTGYDVQIVALSVLANGTSVVSVTLTSPGPNCVAGMVITDRTHMVAIPKSAGPFQFNVQGISRPCH